MKSNTKTLKIEGRPSYWLSRLVRLVQLWAAIGVGVSLWLFPFIPIFGFGYLHITGIHQTTIVGIINLWFLAVFVTPAWLYLMWQQKPFRTALKDFRD